MFEVARETHISGDNTKERLKSEIVSLIKLYELSLSQTRALFHEIVNNIEDEPIK